MHCSEEPPLNWEIERSRYKEGLLNIRPGGTKASFDLTTFVFTRPRDASQCMFMSYFNLFEFLGIEGYKDIPSNWVSSQKPAWSRYLMKAIGSNQIVESIQSPGGVKGGAEKNDVSHAKPPDAMRVLTWTSLPLSEVGVGLIFAWWDEDRPSCTQREGCSLRLHPECIPPQ